MASVFPLLRLPLELRLQIYEQLFVVTTCTLQIYQNKFHLLRARSETSPLPLLLTSKAISQEVQWVLYDATTFKIHLHVQHLPFIQQQRQLVPDDAVVRDLKAGETWEGNAPAFVKHIRGLDLEVWIADSDKTLDMVEQIRALRKLLGTQRELKSLIVRLKWRPRWFSHGCGRMTGEQARALLQCVLQIPCRRGRLVEVDEEMLALMKV